MTDNSQYNKAEFLANFIGSEVDITTSKYFVDNDGCNDNAILVGVKFALSGGPSIIVETNLTNISGGMLVLPPSDVKLVRKNLWELSEYEAREITKIMVPFDFDDDDDDLTIPTTNSYPNIHNDNMVIEVRRADEDTPSYVVLIDREDYDLNLRQVLGKTHNDVGVTMTSLAHCHSLLKEWGYALPYLDLEVHHLLNYGWIKYNEEEDEDLPF